MASHGGMREGSGRPVGAVNKATSELKFNLSSWLDYIPMTP